MVKHAIFYGRKDMPLSISGAKLGFLIWFKNRQIWFSILVVKISISTYQFWFNYQHYLVTRFEHPTHSVCCLIWRRMVLSQLSKLARRCQGMELKSSMPFWRSFPILICTFVLFYITSNPCVLAMNKDAIQRNFLLFCYHIYVAKQCWFLGFV